VQQRDQALAVRMQEAEVAGPAKALGQHVLDDQPQELGRGNAGALYRPYKVPTTAGWTTAHAST